MSLENAPEVQLAVDLIELLETNHTPPRWPWRHSPSFAGIMSASSRKVGRPERPRRRHHVSTHSHRTRPRHAPRGCAVTTPSSRGLLPASGATSAPRFPCRGSWVSTPMASSAPPPTPTANTSGVEVAALEVLPPGLGACASPPRPTPSSCIRACRDPAAHLAPGPGVARAQTDYQSAQQPDFRAPRRPL